MTAIDATTIFILLKNWNSQIFSCYLKFPKKIIVVVNYPIKVWSQADLWGKWSLKLLGCEKNKVLLSNKMIRKKGLDSKIVSCHSNFFSYYEEAATFQLCRILFQSGCLPRVIGHLPSS